jgi:hypothetical protein
VRRPSHYVHEKIPAVSRRSQSFDPHEASCCGSKCKSTLKRNVYPEAHGGHPARSLSGSHRSVNRNVQDQRNGSGPPLCHHPLAWHSFHIRQRGVPIGLHHSSEITCRNHRIENYNHILILTSPSHCVKNINRALPRAYQQSSQPRYSFSCGPVRLQALLLSLLQVR